MRPSFAQQRASEILRRRTKHDLVDVDVFRLTDRKRHHSGKAFSRDAHLADIGLVC